ncbi:hypothetical protein BDV95DRAFT_317228 [Massariosphaeria phaeospora]|uniref:Uncharacterized protein n=1 Tax=Massariosphaeria phaeospora TaxID=100035 RepID=A0A7C8IIS5_9PLEO|nr:hypothetical protein BDV95DRAFT_317228 [Massariosphaeria phaeospora]
METTSSDLNAGVGSRRHHSVSTASSSKYIPIPPGHYILPFHGSCPRCHHYHKAVEIRIKIHEDPSRTSHIHCEACQAKWLSFGGHNTCISLLSTQTAELDHVEQDFRSGLVDVVRSATGPTSLSSVPEILSSRAPSHEHPLRAHSSSAGQDVLRTTALTAEPIPTGRNEHSPNFLGPNNAPGMSFQTAPVTSAFTNKFKKPKIAFHRLIRKLEKRFPILDKLSRTRPAQSSKERKRAVKGKYKLPATEVEDDRDNLTPRAHVEPVANRSSAVDKTKEHLANACTPRKTASEAAALLNGYDKQEIRNMTHEERYAWIRQQITAFQCGCAHDCSCGPVVTPTPALMVNDSIQARIAPEEPLDTPETLRRRSHELLGLGSHFEPGTTFIPTGPLSISQSDTAVEGLIITSASRNSFLEGRSRTPQLERLPPPGSQQAFSRLDLNGVDGSVSMNSLAIAGAVRSAPVVGLSAASVAPVSPTFGSSEAPQLQAQQVLSAGGIDYRATRIHVPAPTPLLNGYHTSNEQDRDSAHS